MKQAFREFIDALLELRYVLVNLLMLYVVTARVVLILVGFFFLTLSHANSLYPLKTPQKEAQFEHLLKNLRCLVCQNQDLADSNAELAKDLRLQVYHLVQEGKSDKEITKYLVSRYGDFVLFNPPVKAVTFLLWFGPLLFLIFGVVIFWRTCFKRVTYE